MEGRAGEGKVSRSSHELVRENKELRDRVALLETRYYRCEQLAREWQNFGQYTARVLKNEMDTYEVKVQLLQEQVEKLARENKELREMCLYLDHSSAGEESKLTPPEATSLLLHTSIMSKLNKRGDGLPQFTGATSYTTLKDSRVGRPRKEAWSGTNTREALAEMKKRVERLEKEKLELIKSLSAAHLLTASSMDHLDPHKQSTTDQLSSNSERLPQPPPTVESLSLQPLPLREENDDSKTEQTCKNDSFSSPELAINAATLLDVCRRLDAAEQSSHKDPMEEVECATLRALLNIAWQKLQEQQLKSVHNTRTTHNTK